MSKLANTQSHRSERKSPGTLSVRPDTHDRLAAEAVRRGCSISELIKLMLDAEAVRA